MLEVKDKVRTFPTLPGVYLMKDAAGRIIYVGKAANLRSRVLNYFRKGMDGRPRIPYLMARLHDIDYLITDTEKEALILENNLIKEHRPRYNIYFRDDKTYYSLRLDLRREYPRPTLVRRTRDDGALYFGPFTSSAAMKSSIRFLQGLFPFRVCSDNVFRHRSRPCLYYQLGRCPAPCVGKITPREYREIIDSLVLFLRGRKRDLLTALRRRMKEAAKALEYEKAARTLARIRAIEETLEKQKISRVGKRSRDIFALECREGAAVIQVLSIREGKMIDGRAEFFHHAFPDEREAMSSFLVQFYDGEIPIPDEIILPFVLANSDDLRAYLGKKKRGKVIFTVPVRGEKRELLKLARKNARFALHQQQAEPGTREVLLNLQTRLGLRHYPVVIECFDISNLGGREAVGSMVVFKEGKKYPAGYRRYRIKMAEGPDDYGMIFELLRRSLRRGKEAGRLPELIVVDGGKGQLNVALRALGELGIDFPDLLALAKKKRLKTGRVIRDRIYLPGQKTAVLLRSSSPLLRLLMRVRDEAHRFAIRYHRKLRIKERLASPLDGVPGIGPVLKNRLLGHFDTIKAIRQASAEELAEIKGVSLRLAEDILNILEEVLNKSKVDYYGKKSGPSPNSPV
ncbi:MAG: excinuclease ABC subunit UvrC [Candidatus Euphemobacter frigidus]|nr:excinuclease ABC subunit UvrC [Candidatus Euphemobacter frigidus]MDP8276259.1 excinuclease ABC subunit UvrC [Candidatus Euphemobacter frigidus]